MYLRRRVFDYAASLSHKLSRLNEVSMNEKPPFAVQAAKASWIAPLMAIVLGIAGTTFASGDSHTDPETLRTIALILGGICGVIVVAGLVFGIAALFGIRKHGAKGILLPSIIGILLCSGWLYLVYNSIQVARQAAERHAQMNRQ